MLIILTVVIKHWNEPHTRRQKNRLGVAKTVEFFGGKIVEYLMVGMVGLEPTASSSRTTRATSCATSRHVQILLQLTRANFRSPAPASAAFLLFSPKMRAPELRSVRTSFSGPEKIFHKRQKSYCH